MMLMTDKELAKFLPEQDDDYVFPEDVVDPETGDVYAMKGENVLDVFRKVEHILYPSRKKYARYSQVEELEEEPEPLEFDDVFEVIYEDETIGEMLVDYDEDQIQDYDLDLKPPMMLKVKSGKGPTPEEKQLAEQWIREWNRNFKDTGVKIDHYYSSPEFPEIDLNFTFWR